MIKLARCVCGTYRKPIIWQRAPHSLLRSLRCPVCGFKSRTTRTELLFKAWNDEVRLAQQQPQRDPHRQEGKR